MKKTKSGRRAASGKSRGARKSKRASLPKRRGAPRSVDEYLARVPEPARSTLCKMRAAIRSAVPREATETISYGIPAFKHKGVLVWFAAFSNDCSLFPTTSVIEAFKNELKGRTVSKGTIQFPVDKPLPAGLIRKVVRARVAQADAKHRH